MRQLVSVLIPTYNSESWLSRCLDSIIKQSYTNIEILVYNDGSTDNTADIIHRYATKDGRIRIIGTKRVGIAAARNILIDESNGQMAMFIDSDDWIESQTIEKLVKLIIEDNLDFCGCSMFYDYFNKTELLIANPPGGYTIYKRKDVVYQYLDLTQLHGSLCNKLIKTEILKKNRFNTGWDFAEDSSFLWKVLNVVNRVGLTSERLYHYCAHAESLSERNFRVNQLRFVESWKCILEDVEKDYPEFFNKARASFAFIVMSTLNSIMRSEYNDKNVIDNLMDLLSRNRILYFRHPKGGLRYMLFLCAISVSQPLTFSCFRNMKNIQY